MSQNKAANLLPAEIRKHILEKNLIHLAIGRADSVEMQELMIYWKEFFEPDLIVTCNVCYERVYNNYKGLLLDLINLEKESRLLDAN